MSSTVEQFMGEALQEAELAASEGEVPVGAVVVVDGKIIARAHNLVETNNDPTAHAEVLALRQAAASLQSWRLAKADLYVTLEPCPMCIGASLHARIKSLYFGANDPQQGAVGSRFDLSQHVGLFHEIETHSGIMENESKELLQSFFKKRRAESKV